MNDVRAWLVDTIGTEWTYALVGGLLSVVWLLGSHPPGTSDIDTTPILLVAIVAGYFYSDGSRETGTVGRRIGLFGALAVLWLTRGFFLGIGGDILTAETLWFGVVAPVFLGLALTLLVGMAVVSGWLGVAVGGWLARKNGRTRSQAAA